MPTLVNANVPVSDMERSVTFYESLGFKQNENFSIEDVKTMVWDENFWVVLMNYNFFEKIIDDKKIADTKAITGIFISFYVDSPDIVKEMAETARKNGGNYYRVDVGVPEEEMYGVEILDPDGNLLEVSWMKM